MSINFLTQHKFSKGRLNAALEVLMEYKAINDDHLNGDAQELEMYLKFLVSDGYLSTGSIREIKKNKMGLDHTIYNKIIKNEIKVYERAIYDILLTVTRADATYWLYSSRIAYYTKMHSSISIYAFEKNPSLINYTLLKGIDPAYGIEITEAIHKDHQDYLAEIQGENFDTDE